MRFFEKQRPEVYIHTARLKRDKKSGQRLWQFTLIVTMSIEQVQACDVPIAKAWEYITDRDSAAVDVLIASEVEGCEIEFFAQIDDANPVLHLEGVDLVGLRFTRDKNTVEFWFSGEHVNEGGIHDFMKPYAYTRCWAQFTTSQAELEMTPEPKIETQMQARIDRLVDIAAQAFDAAKDPAKLAELHRRADGNPELAGVLASMDNVAKMAREVEATVTLSTAGMDPVVIDKAGADRIHAVAKDAKSRKRMKDPG